DRLECAGLLFSGTSPDQRLVEYVELSREEHPFYVGTQAHPELKSRPTRPHPLFRAFVRAAVASSAESQLPVELPDAGPERAESERRGAPNGRAATALQSV